METTGNTKKDYHYYQNLYWDSAKKAALDELNRDGWHGPKTMLNIMSKHGKNIDDLTGWAFWLAIIISQETELADNPDVLTFNQILTDTHIACMGCDMLNRIEDMFDDHISFGYRQAKTTFKIFKANNPKA